MPLHSQTRLHLKKKDSNQECVPAKSPKNSKLNKLLNVVDFDAVFRLRML